jgi:hypothetical protein
MQIAQHSADLPPTKRAADGIDDHRILDVHL